MSIKIAPSILSADFSKLGQEVKDISQYRIDFLHIDIMDGHFVPNITIGPAVVKAIRPYSELPFETHLMISEPLKYIDSFIQAGANIITLHIETIKEKDFIAEAKRLRQMRVKIAVSLNPETEAGAIENVSKFSDMVLVMTVQPGFGGRNLWQSTAQDFPDTLFLSRGYCVDGGIDGDNSKLAVKAGANILACGTYIFKAKDRQSAIEELRNA